eukprot:5278685-Amphidinium_carterae.1
MCLNQRRLRYSSGNQADRIEEETFTSPFVCVCSLIQCCTSVAGWFAGERLSDRRTLCLQVVHLPLVSCGFMADVAVAHTT